MSDERGELRESYGLEEAAVAARDQQLALALDALRTHAGPYAVITVNGGPDRTATQIYASYNAQLVGPADADPHEVVANVQPSLRRGFFEFCAARFLEAAVHEAEQ